jgi:hypothetical protein
MYIVNKMTISAMALSIFRMEYSDSSTWEIHIPTQNEDTFIRRAYFGGHVDVYRPFGKNLYYYDVNSLYPFVMQHYHMPGGIPVWDGQLKGKSIDSLFGLRKCYIICPRNHSL